MKADQTRDGQDKILAMEIRDIFAAAGYIMGISGGEIKERHLAITIKATAKRNESYFEAKKEGDPRGETHGTWQPSLMDAIRHFTREFGPNTKFSLTTGTGEQYEIQIGYGDITYTAEGN